jgi:hypothetical protein
MEMSWFSRRCTGIARHCGLGLEIELAERPIRKLLHDPHRSVDPEFRKEPLGQARKEVENVDILLDDLPDAGPLDLDRDLGAVFERRAMHLRQGGRRRRNLLERGEHVFGVPAQLRFDDLPHGLIGKRADIILELGQLLGELRADQIGPHAENLPEFDEGRTQPLQQRAHGRREQWRPRHGPAPLGGAPDETAGGAAAATGS